MLCLRILLPAASAAALLLLWRPLAAPASPEATDRAKQFVKDHEARLRKLEVAASRAWWDANLSGKDQDFERKVAAQNKIDEALADPKTFKELKALRDQRKD